MQFTNRAGKATTIVANLFAVAPDFNEVVHCEPGAGMSVFTDELAKQMAAAGNKLAVVDIGLSMAMARKRK